MTHPGCFFDLLRLQQEARHKCAAKEVLGKKIYQQVEGQLFDPHKEVYLPVRLGGGVGTNMDLMNSGCAPIGVDGNPVNLHHIGQSNNSSLVEITQDLHNNRRHQLYVYSGLKRSKFPQDVVPVDREIFNIWREEYWQTRAMDFE